MKARKRLKKNKGVVLFVLPYVAVMFGLILFPFVFNIWLSFHKAGLTGKIESFVGVANFVKLFRSSLFKSSLTITFWWTCLSVIGQLGLGLFTAIAMNQRLRGINFMRSLLCAPYVVPTAVVVLCWVYFYNPMFGISQYVLQSLKITKEPIEFLGNPKYALLSVIVVNIWRGFPFVMLMLLARMQGLPTELYEAARIDGASALQRFRFLTIPLLIPVIVIIGFFRCIWVFNYFGLIFLMTAGGPMRSTQTLPVMLYKTAFEKWRLGEASAIAVFNSAILIGFYVFYHYVLERRIRYY